MLGSEPGHAILFRVYHHASEFIDIEFLSSNGQPLLLKQHRPSIVKRDGGGGNEHKRACDNKSQNAADEIQRPLGHLLVQRQAGVTA